jgi:hypothetical protein
MARATRVDFPGAWYHVLNRGTERRAIFRSMRCREKFIQLLSSLPNGSGLGLWETDWKAQVKYTVFLGSAEFVAQMRKLLRGDRDQQTGVRRGTLETLTWTQIVQAVSNVWNEPWEELLTARGTGARQTAFFIGRIRGRLSLKELGRLAGGIHQTATSRSPRMSRMGGTPKCRLYSRLN